MLQEFVERDHVGLKIDSNSFEWRLIFRVIRNGVPGRVWLNLAPSSSNVDVAIGIAAINWIRTFWHPLEEKYFQVDHVAKSLGIGHRKVLACS
jgi:hypothetical protein